MDDNEIPDDFEDTPLDVDSEKMLEDYLAQVEADTFAALVQFEIEKVKKQ